MINRRIIQISAFTATLSAIIVLSWWVKADPTSEYNIALPGMDNVPEELYDSASIKEVEFGSVFHFNKLLDKEISGEWPRFRGGDFSNISRETNLISSQVDVNSRILWSVELGEGHAGAAVKYGRVYLLDYDEEYKADILKCLSLSDGSELWHTGYNVTIKRNHGISRTVPAVSDSFVVTIGPRCHVMCVSAITGQVLWGKNLEKDFGVKVPLWYTGQCPLIDKNTVVIAVGGDILMMGIDIKSGDILWQTPNDQGYKMSHSSIIPMQVHGVNQYVYSAVGGLIGISAEENNIGNLLWTCNDWSHSVIAPSPVLLENNKIFVSAGYSAGSMLIQLSYSDNEFSAKPIQTITPSEGIASEQQTPVYHDGQLCAVLPKDAGALKEQFACFDSQDISKLVWSSGKTKRFGLGPYMFADDKYLILDDEGQLTIINADSDYYNEILQTDLLGGHDAWAPLALAGSRLILRDSKTMICVDIGKDFNPGLDS